MRTIQRLEKGDKPSRPYYLEDICLALGYQLRQESIYTLTPVQKLIDTTI
jgi:hypothetical protein